MKQPVSTPDAPEAIGPYTQAIRAGDFLFLSGQIPLDPVSGQMIDGDVEAQAERVLANAEAVLREAGLEFADVVKTTIFLASMNDFARVNAVYARSFQADPPARSTVEVSRLPKDAKVEMEFVAFRGATGGGA